MNSKLFFFLKSWLTYLSLRQRCVFCLGESRKGAIHLNSTSFQKRFQYGQGCHGQGKVREKQKFFKVREKSGNFAKSQGKSQFLSKSVKSQGILFSGWRKVL